VYKLKKYATVLLIVLVNVIIFTGCSVLRSNNNAFEFMKEKKATKITIQSTRDKSYKFTVTDVGVAQEIYKILSSAKEVDTKSPLEADYIFEIYEGPDKVHKFNYIAGLDKNDGANFYNDDKNYIVSKRLDNDIIKNFWNIRIPIDFQNVYYNTIYEAVDMYKKSKEDNPKIGINMSSDLEMSKFILSTDLLNFEQRFNKMSDVALVKDAKVEGFDIVMNINTEGYTSTKYKAIITFKGHAGEYETNYYVVNKYEKGEWKIGLYEKKPDDF